MFILKSFPTADRIEPEEFIQGSRADLEDVTRKFCEQYNSDVGVLYANEWEDFRDNIAPQSDSVQEWVRDHPLHIPFHNTLVRGDPVNLSMPGPDVRDRCAQDYSTTAHSRPRKSIPLDYVTWARRGEVKQRNDPSNFVPNIVVEGPRGMDRYSVPIQCKEVQHSVVAAVSSSGFRLPPLVVSGEAADVTVIDVAGSEEDESSADSESTDSDNEIDGWVRCPGAHHMPFYGCARDCVGNTFTVPKQFINKSFFGGECQFGKILSVVKKAGAEKDDVFFKFYNYKVYPDDPPPDDSDCYFYIPCVDFMSSSLSRRKMEWDKSYKENVRKTPAPKEKRTFWQMENVAPALFDEEVDVDVSSVRRLRSGRPVASDIDSAVALPNVSSSSTSLTSPTVTSPSTTSTLHAVSSSSSASSSSPRIQQSRRGLRSDSSVSAPTTTSSSSVSSTLPATASSSSSPTLLSPISRSCSSSLPPTIHEHREYLRKKTHASLVKKGLRTEEAVDELVELSDCSDSDSDSDSGSDS
jgi:hypothetical protein